MFIVVEIVGVFLVVDSVIFDPIPIKVDTDKFEMDWEVFTLEVNMFVVCFGVACTIVVVCVIVVEA